MMKIIKNIVIDEERAFYSNKNIEFKNITISGPKDGESAFKECSNIKVISSKFKLRYPFWHDNKLKVKSCTLFKTCRAPIWYSKNIEFDQVKINGVKAFRECANIQINNCNFVSPEIFWNCKNIDIKKTNIDSVYAFFGSRNFALNNVNFTGKYSFQYTKDGEINNCVLKTKDAFWHSKNITVKDSVIEGEYLGWYSENLTLINCKIKGTQPLCYAKNLKIIDCTMEDCDLAFEYSKVNGNILSEVKSIKNPLAGKLEVAKCDEVIVDENDRSKGNFKLIIK